MCCYTSSRENVSVVSGRVRSSKYNGRSATQPAQEHRRPPTAYSRLDTNSRSRGPLRSTCTRPARTGAAGTSVLLLGAVVGSTDDASSVVATFVKKL